MTVLNNLLGIVKRYLLDNVTLYDIKSRCISYWIITDKLEGKSCNHHWRK
jgi:hypothetical protein